MSKTDLQARLARLVRLQKKYLKRGDTKSARGFDNLIKVTHRRLNA